MTSDAAAGFLGSHPHRSRSSRRATNRCAAPGRLQAVMRGVLARTRATRLRRARERWLALLQSDIDELETMQEISRSLSSMLDQRQRQPHKTVRD